MNLVSSSEESHFKRVYLIDTPSPSAQFTLLLNCSDRAIESDDDENFRIQWQKDNIELEKQIQFDAKWFVYFK